MSELKGWDAPFTIWQTFYYATMIHSQNFAFLNDSTISWITVIFVNERVHFSGYDSFRLKISSGLVINMCGVEVRGTDMGFEGTRRVLSVLHLSESKYP